MKEKNFGDKLMDLVQSENNLPLVVSSLIAMLGVIAGNADVELKKAEGNVTECFRHHFLLARELRDLKEKQLH